MTSKIFQTINFCFLPYKSKIKTLNRCDLFLILYMNIFIQQYLIFNQLVINFNRTMYMAFLFNFKTTVPTEWYSIYFYYTTQKQKHHVQICVLDNKTNNLSIIYSLYYTMGLHYTEGHYIMVEGVYKQMINTISVN